MMKQSHANLVSVRKSSNNAQRLSGFDQLAALCLVIGLCACDVAPGAETEPPALAALAQAPCELWIRYYVIDELELPVDVEQAEQLGMDLDGDGDVDNNAGLVIAQIASEYEGARAQLSSSVEASLTGHKVNWILGLSRCTDNQTHARVHLYEGADTNRDGVLELAIAIDSRVPAVGTLSNQGELDVRDGEGIVPVSALFDVLGVADTVEWSPARGLALSAQLAQVESLAGILAAGLEPEMAVQAAALPLAGFFSTLVGTGRSPLADQLDHDGDGRVSGNEVRTNIVVRLFAMPALALMAKHNGQLVYWPGHGTPDYLGLGLGFHATPVTLGNSDI